MVIFFGSDRDFRHEPKMENDKIDKNWLLLRRDKDLILEFKIDTVIEINYQFSIVINAIHRFV
jgi:hypothetical protein